MRIAALLLLLTLPLFGERIYTQTDAAAAQCSEAEALACSVETSACGTPINKLAEDSGTAGTSEVLLSIAAGTQCMCAWFEAENVNDAGWAGGTGEINLEVTTTDTATWVNYNICLVSSTCGSPTSVDSATGLTHDLSTTPAVKVQATSWSAQAGAGATDLWLVTLGCTGDGAHGNDAPGITPSQTITTPLDALEAGRTRTVVADD